MSPLFGGEHGGTLEVIDSGEGLRFRVDRLGLGAVSVVLRGDELERFAAFLHNHLNPEPPEEAAA